MRDRYRAIAWRYRSLPGVHGLRQHTVEVGISSWSGTNTGEGTESITWTAITESGGLPPKVRWATDEEVALGQFPSGGAEVGPITPTFPLVGAGGTDHDVLTGEDAVTGEIFKIRITGPRHPDGAIYRMAQVHEDQALHYTLRGAPVGTV